MRRMLLTLALALALPGMAGAQEVGGFGLHYTPPAPVKGTAGWTFDGPLLLPAGTSAAPSMAFIDEPGLGFYRSSASYLAVPLNKYLIVAPGSNYGVLVGTGGVTVGSSGQIGFSSGSPTGTIQSTLVRDGTNAVALKYSNNDQLFRVYGANGAYIEYGTISELVTIAAAASTDSTANMLPADAVIDGVVARVVTVIPTAATFSIGDATTATRFMTGISTAATTTAVGMTHLAGDISTAAAGPTQTTAAKVRITPNAQPAAATGQVRVTVWYRKFVPGTS